MSVAADDLPNIVVMGVSGCGKSTVGERLAVELQRTFVEGDDYHSTANVGKMSAGIPLTDEDRWPWLDALADLLAEADAAQAPQVMSCSSLRRAYRDRLRAGSPTTIFVHLAGPREVLLGRMTVRAGHFMPARLLDSQLATLEPLAPDEAGAVVDLQLPIPDLIRTVLEKC